MGCLLDFADPLLLFVARDRAVDGETGGSSRSPTVGAAGRTVPGVVAWISLLVSLGAVVISGLSYLRAGRDDRSADPVAYLTTEAASIDGGPVGPIANLGIENRGKHDAKKIDIYVEFLLADRQVDATRLRVGVAVADVNGRPWTRDSVCP
jgi:hypothetical protein